MELNYISDFLYSQLKALPRPAKPMQTTRRKVKEATKSMAIPTRAHAEFWATQALATCEPVFISFRFGDAESEADAKRQARRCQQVFSSMRFGVRMSTRKVQKNPAFPGPYDDIVCEVLRRDDRYVVRIEYLTEFDLAKEFEVSIGKEEA